MLPHVPMKMSDENDPRCQTGVPGLDDILNGGLIAHYLYLLEGTPGAGKTTMAIKYLQEGLFRREKCLYVTRSETGGVVVYPRLIAAEPGAPFPPVI